MVRRAAAAGLQGVGPAASASLVPWLHPRGTGTGAGAGARGREPPRERLRSRDPFQRFRPRGGQRRPRRSRWERSPPRGPQSSGVVALPNPAHLASFPALRAASCPWGLGSQGRERGDQPGRGARKEKRSLWVLQDCCDNTAPGVGGEREEWDSENGKLGRGFRSTTHLVSTPGLFHLPGGFYR